MTSTVLRNVHSWQDYKSRVTSLSTKEKGDAFELLVKYYLQINPLYKTKLKSVWLLNEVSTYLKQKLNLPSTDQGIDLVAETYEGEYWSIQCKYRDDEDTTISWREVSTFAGLSFSVCKNISFGLICTTSNRITKVLSNQENIAFCSGEIWRNSDAEFFITLNSLIKGKVKPVKALKPRPHQKSAIKNAVQHFIADDNTRGKMIMPCGSGKSLTAFWIADKLDAKNILVAVPSLALIRQSLKSWLRESLANKKEIKWICVASDETVGSIKKDDVAILKQDLGVPAMTDPERIATWLKENTKYTKVIFTTYQSGKSLADAAKKANVIFDLGIMDEAHKTVGSRNKLFSYLLFDDNIRIKKRIFMTATERRYAGLRDEIISMEDPSIYGETFELQTFKEAIEVKPPILSDYKILTILVTRDEIEKLIENNAYVIPDKGSWDDEIEAEMLASNIALQKAVEKYPIRHAISFHSSISKARAFQNTQTKYSDTFQKTTSLSTYHVSGNMPTSDRDKIIGEFLTNSPSLVTNARCLTEGVDIPNIDCVLFADPKRSTVDIVQAVGRALRIAEGKEFGYVIIPVLTNAEKDEEEILDSESFKEVLTTLRALASNDERIIEYFSAISKRKQSHDLIRIEVDEKIGEKIDSEKFINSIELKIWDKLAKLHWMRFEEARALVHSLHLKSQNEWFKFCRGMLDGNKKPENLPTQPSVVYNSSGWINWGDWLGTNLIATQLREYWTYDRANSFVVKLGLNSASNWRKYCKGQIGSLETKPDFIPNAPNWHYEGKGWKSWGDWLGTGKVATNYIKYINYQDGCKFVTALGLKTSQDWFKYCKGQLKNKEKLPSNIPVYPYQTYKNNGWKNWGDWLGTGNVSSSEIKFRSFKSAKKYVHTLNIKNGIEWRRFPKGILPPDIPKLPWKTYKGKGWKGMKDWLGTENSICRKDKVEKFKSDRNFVRKLGLLNYKQWKKYIKGEYSDKEPILSDLPANPQQVYKKYGWKGWGDWLGTGKVSTRLAKFKKFEDSRKYIRKLNLKSQAQWHLYTKGELKGKAIKPIDIPSNPQRTYKNSGWKNWADWLGTRNVSTQKMKYRSYPKAKVFAHTLGLQNEIEWRKFPRELLPIDIPKTPWKVYKNKGWKGMKDWLGTE